MPFTPFHFGPGLVGKAIAPRWFSWSAFVVTQIVIDVETLYNILRRSYPLHTFLHTLVGATIASIAVAVAVIGNRATIRHWLALPSPEWCGEANAAE